MQSGPNCTKACWKAPPQTPNSQSKALWLWLLSDGIPLPYFTQSAAFSVQGKNKTPASPIRLDHQSSTSHLRRNVKDRHFLKMITAFVIISACTRCHEKRRIPAQPQRLRWQVGAWGRSQPTSILQKLLSLHCLLLLSRIRNNYYALGLLSTFPAERQNRTHKKNNFKS